MNYYENHIGDYLKDTAHLSLLEHGVYKRLLDVYYTRETALPDDVARLIGARSKDEKAALVSVLQEFFVKREDGYHQSRCDAEIARYQDKQAKAKRSAEARWGASRSQSEGNANASADGMRTHSEGNALQTPDTSNQSPSSIPSNLSVAPAFHEKAAGTDLLGESFSEGPSLPPDCPHKAVLGVWAEVMPDLPQHEPELWKGTRADHLRARWRETAVLKGWRTPDDGLQYFRKLLTWCRHSQFLMGKAQTKDRRPFEFELAWLVNPTNWAKTLEGKYHGQG